MYKILVTDGVNKNTLSILRHLDPATYKIDVTTHFPRHLTVCNYSRYRNKIHYFGSDKVDIEAYANELLNVLKSTQYDVLIPVGLSSCITVSNHREDFLELTRVIAPTWENMVIAANKDRTMALADRIGVPIPKTQVISGGPDLDEITDFPVVIKSSDDSGKSVRYCTDSTQLRNNYLDLKSSSRTKMIVQEYVEGFGCGFFAIYQDGCMIRHFLHRRLKEFPVTGGPSAVAESFFDERLLYYGKKISDALHWNGPIMAEFKYDVRSDDFKLIEVNPKLWGSLDLTIAAGVNIPEILVSLALGNPIQDERGYRYIRYRWVFPDEFKFLLSNPSFPNIKDFFSLQPDTVTNISFTDPLPTVFQGIRSVIDGLSLTLNPQSRYPHGKI